MQIGTSLPILNLYKSGIESDALLPYDPTRTKPPRNFKMISSYNKKR